MNNRSVCWACRRPQVVCYCHLLPKLQTRFSVLFLQHPRERRMPIGTARMAYLALPASRLYEGVSFEAHPEVSAALDAPGTALLYPGDGASAVPPDPPWLRQLVVLDGTWPQARKMLRLNPRLEALPRVKVPPGPPGNYRIRLEPAAHCLSTVEAVTRALGALDGPPERFEPLLSAFERMVDWQIERRATNDGPPRRKLKQGPPRILPQAVVEDPRRAVLFYAESNAIPLGPRRPQTEHDWVQLAAERPAEGVRLHMLVAPTRALAPGTPRHLEVGEDQLLSGMPRDEALRQWHAFCRPDDVALSWGFFSRNVMASAGARLPSFVDLRTGVARTLQGRPGNLESAPSRLGRKAREAWAPGRAGRRLGAMSAVAEALLRIARG